jgi:UDP-N-acetylglucosamine acyltransferase
MPQHAHMPERAGRVIVGSGNVIRENVTFHRALEADDATIIGDNNLFMVNVHIAHDCRVGNNTIFANNAMMAGHVTVGDRAFLSGNAVVHQFCRIGRLVMVGGMARITNDVPPFMTVEGIPAKVRGLNTVGLRRAEYPLQVRMELKRLLREIYCSPMTVSQAVAAVTATDHSEAGREMLEFFKTSKRGVTACSLLTKRGAESESDAD